jgi:hypothetical protein
MIQVEAGWYPVLLRYERDFQCVKTDLRESELSSELKLPLDTSQSKRVLRLSLTSLTASPGLSLPGRHE